MSCVTGILIFHSPSEEDELEDRVKEINEFGDAGHWFSNKNIADCPDEFWGGSKHSQLWFIGAGLNYVNLQEFIEHIRTKVAWKYLEDVQILYQEENNDRVTLINLLEEQS